MGVICPNCKQHLGESDWCPTCLRHNDSTQLCGCPECAEPERDEPDDASLPDGWDDADPF